MSDVEKFFYSLSKQFGVSANWNDIDALLQMEFVNGLNGIIHVMAMLQQFNPQSNPES